MDNLLVKYQLLFLGFIIAIASSIIFGISSTRQMVDSINPTTIAQSMTNPVSEYYSYRLAKAESNNQTILETIINPKQTPQTSSQNYAQSVPVLVYHGIVEKPDDINVSLAQFKSQMYALKIAGYQTVSLEDYTKFLNGQKQLPEKSMLLTFDDGRKDSYQLSDPILKAIDFKALMFVITEHLSEENPYYLSASELHAMEKTGRWNVEAHSQKAHDLYPIDENGTIGHF